ncbi:MAG: VCBS repeat-containing protein [Prosthecobacter sp.]
MRPVLFSLLATVALADPAALYLDGPEVVKLDWDTFSPRAGDFNGDGLTDLAIVNASRARIEFLLQRKDGVRPGDPEKSARTDRWNPILEVSRFDKQPLVIGRAASALTVGDWNGDGKSDVAYVTDDEKLILRMQGAKADWTQKREFALDSVADDTETLVARDLNGDGRDDIALLTGTRLMVLIQKAGGGWEAPQNHALGETGCGGLAAADLDGDGRADLFYTAAEGDAVLVRLQQDGAAFGEEWRLEIPVTRHWLHPVRLGAGQTGFAWVQDETNMVEVAKLIRGKAEPNADRAVTIRHAMPPSGSKNGAVVFGDLTGDGAADVLMSEPKAARVWLFEGRPDGTFGAGREFPVLSGVEALAIADIDRDAKPDLVLLSPGEKAVGLAHWKNNRLTYPEIVYQAAEGEKLLALTTGSLDEKDAAAIVCITEIKTKPQLVTLRKAGGKGLAVGTQALDVKTTGLNGVRLVDANQDGRQDLALFSSLGPMNLLLSTGDAKSPFKRAGGIPDSFVSKIALRAHHRRSRQRR